MLVKMKPFCLIKNIPDSLVSYFITVRLQAGQTGAKKRVISWLIEIFTATSHLRGKKKKKTLHLNYRESGDLIHLFRPFKWITGSRKQKRSMAFKPHHLLCDI